MSVRPSIYLFVCPSVCHLHAGFLSKRLNILKLFSPTSIASSAVELTCVVVCQHSRVLSTRYYDIAAAIWRTTSHRIVQYSRVAKSMETGNIGPWASVTIEPIYLKFDRNDYVEHATTGAKISGPKGAWHRRMDEVVKSCATVRGGSTLGPGGTGPPNVGQPPPQYFGSNSKNTHC